MTPTQKLYLTTFLWTGIPFGTISTLLFMPDNISGIIAKWSFLTMFYGLSMSLILGKLTFYRMKKQGIEITEENLKTEQSKTIVADISQELLLERLHQDSIMNRMIIRSDKNIIHIRSGLSRWSWGEQIYIRLKADQPATQTIEISSKPVLSLTIFDYGKNRENVERIVRLIKTTT